MTSSELISKISEGGSLHKARFSFKEVVHFAKGISNNGNLIASEIKVGDVFINRTVDKPRPSLVLKVGSDACLVCDLSTTKDYMYVCDIKSRFYFGHVSASTRLLRKESILNNMTAVSEAENIDEIIIKLRDKLTL